MTTFQYIIQSLLNPFFVLYPLPPHAPDQYAQTFLSWPAISPELRHLCALLVFGLLVFLYRYDVLGMLSGLVKSLVNPASLKPERRSLDQQITIFVLGIALSFFLWGHTSDFILSDTFQTLVLPEKIVSVLRHPLFQLFSACVGSWLIYLGLKLNKKLYGLNQIRWMDLFKIIFSGALLLLPGMPLLAVLYFVLLATHHHLEVVLKYSHLSLMIILGLQLIVPLPGQSSPSLAECVETLGMMNVVVVSVVTLFFTWIILEALPKSFHEFHLRKLIWLTPFLALGYIGVTLWN